MGDFISCGFCLTRFESFRVALWTRRLDLGRNWLREVMMRRLQRARGQLIEAMGKPRGKNSQLLYAAYFLGYMNIIVLIIGWLVLLLGLLGIASPHSLVNAVLGMSSATRFYVTVIVRIVVGIIFLFAARRCRVAWLVYLFGVIILLSGIVLLFLGAGRLDEIINWFAARSDAGLRSAYVVDVIIGALLIFAGSKRR
jgi:hypothetical protein